MIRLDTEIGEHRYQIFTGYRGEADATRQALREQRTAAGTTGMTFASRPEAPRRGAEVASDAPVPPPPVLTCACCAG